MNKVTIIPWREACKSQKIFDFLHKNAVLIAGTDTVYGFLAASTQQGLKNLQKEKGVLGSKSVLLLISSLKKLAHFVNYSLLSPGLKRLLELCWPGPVTIIFKAKEGVEPHLVSPVGTIALRVPAHQELCVLLEHFDALFSTSANITGQPTPQNFNDLDPVIVQHSYYIIKNEYELFSAQASTIIDCSALQDERLCDADKKIKVIRNGAFAISDLEKLYGEPFDAK